MKPSAFAILPLLLVSAVHGGAPMTDLLTEDFETDGEGSRYTSSAFDDGGSDFFERLTTNPDPRHLAVFTFTAPQGGSFWGSEDVDDGAPSNPLGDHGIVRLNNLAVTGFNNLTVSVFLATTETMRFDIEDKIEIQVAVDGDSGGADLTAGTYTTIGRFIGNGPDIFASEEMKLDADLDGVVFNDPSDAGSPTLDSTMREFVFNVPFTGDNLSVQVRIEQNGGSEEIAFDHIRVQGVATATDPPVLAGIEGGAVMFTEGDPATVVTSSLVVSDPDSADLVSATVRFTAGHQPSEDSLAVGSPGGLGINYDAPTGTLDLFGTASLATYQTALRSVTYANSNTTNPSTAIRTLQFQVRDGGNSSNFQTRNVQVTGTVATGTIPHLEDLNTDGEGVRYTSSTYRSGDDFFERSDVNPAPDHAASFAFNAPQGGGFWASEDVDSAGNPLGDHGILRLQNLDATGLSNIEVSLFLAEIAPNGEGPEDKIEIQYAFDGDIPGSPTDLSSGTYTTVGRFVPASPDQFTTGPMTLDSDLDAVVFGDPDDSGSPELTPTMTKYTFTIPAVGNTLSVQMRLQQNGGSEELAIDHIEVTGSAVVGTPPTLANIEGSPLSFQEGDPATQLTNTITVADPDPSEIASATVQITGNFDPSEDLLSTDGGVPPSITVGAFSPGTGTLELTGPASPADFETALRAVTYGNSDPVNPSPATRTVSMQVVDGDGNPSNTVARQISVVPVLPQGTLPVTEDFETDGNGERYVANSFNTGASNSFFERVTANPDPRHGTALTFVAPQGGAYWAGEDVQNVANPLGDHGIIRLPDLAVTGWTDLEVTVYLAQGADKFDLADKIEIQYALDAGSGAGDLNSGSYTTVGRFVGDTADVFGDGPLTLDGDLNGTADSGAPVLTSTMTPYAFSLPSGGDLLSVQVRVEQNGGSEEFAIDQLSVTGTQPIETVLNTDDSGPGSLRQALIDLPANGKVLFDPALDGSTITLTSGQLFLSKNVTIDGSGLARGLTVSAGGASRVMRVVSGTSVTLDKLTVADGFVAGFNQGGGVLNQGSLVVHNCTFLRNRGGGGGAIASVSTGSSLEVANSTFTTNTAIFGGAMLFRDGTFDLIHCTVVGNTATSGTAGFVLEGGAAHFENNIVANNFDRGNRANFGGSGTLITVAGQNLVGANNGSYTGDFPDDGFLIGTSANPIDPVLTPLGPHGGCTGTMHPLAGSPAFEAGFVTGNTPGTDQRGFTRVVGFGPDLGAVEGGPPFLVSNTADSGPGSLREALLNASSVAGARIYFDIAVFPAPGPITLAPATNQLVANAQTVFIDGSQIAGGVAVDGGNAVRILEVGNGSAVALVNLVLQNGNTAGSTDTDSGAIRISGTSSVNLLDCTVANNVSQSRAGAIYARAGDLLQATRCDFSSNTSGGNNGGGAIYSEGAGGAVRLVDCSFTDNQSPTTAGAIHSIGGASLHAEGCYFARNSAIDAGAVRSTDGARSVLENCTFEENEVTAAGGAIFTAGSNYNLVVRHCTIVGNKAGTDGTGSGGGIRKNGGGSLTLENSIVSGNTAPGGPDYQGGVTVAAGVNLIGSTSGTGGLGVEGTDYLVGAPDVAPASNYGGPTLSRPPLPASPAVDGAVPLATSPATDQRGFARSQGGGPDIGAVERSALVADNGPSLVDDTNLQLTDEVSRDDTAGDTLFFRYTVDPLSDFTTENYFAAFQLYEGGAERLGVGNAWVTGAYSVFLTSVGDLDLNSANPEPGVNYEFVRSGVPRSLVFRVDFVPGGPDNVSVWLSPDVGLPEFAQEPELLTQFTVNCTFDEVLLRNGGGGTGWEFSGMEISELSPFATPVTFAGLHPGLDPNGDENGDGLTNYHHYASGDDPVNPVLLPTLLGDLYSHPVRINGSDVFYNYEFSTDLQNFVVMIPGIHYTVDSTSSLGPNVREVTIEVLFDPNAEARVFWRHRFDSIAP